MTRRPRTGRRGPGCSGDWQSIRLLDVLYCHRNLLCRRAGVECQTPIRKALPVPCRPLGRTLYLSTVQRPRLDAHASHRPQLHPLPATLPTANKPSPLGRPSLVLGEALQCHWLATGPLSLWKLPLHLRPHSERGKRGNTRCRRRPGIPGIPGIGPVVSAVWTATCNMTGVGEQAGTTSTPRCPLHFPQSIRVFPAPPPSGPANTLPPPGSANNYRPSEVSATCLSFLLHRPRRLPRFASGALVECGIDSRRCCCPAPPPRLERGRRSCPLSRAGRT